MFQEMQDQLTRGFQLHVYVYTVHHVLHNLVEGKKLLPGHITP